MSDKCIHTITLKRSNSPTLIFLFGAKSGFPLYLYVYGLRFAPSAAKKDAASIRAMVEECPFRFRQSSKSLSFQIRQQFPSSLSFRKNPGILLE
ncbi:hypothetical protein [Chryseobacterium sp. MMS23-Vi53]|uniref:hypothetical protein n=1 Tax=Chryseobacterium sp. MMS23-Vi53 TaxID=3386644 RepID=UPI0039E83928